MSLAVLLAAPAAADAGAFAGAWSTTFGDMTLVEEAGGRVHGTYLMGGQRCAIEGRREGATLTFLYQEPDASGEGRFELAADGASFEGVWRPRGQSAWSPWRGARPAAGDRARGFAGLWATDFGRRRVAERGGRLEGLYAFGDGSLSGNAAGRVLRFRYKDVAEGEGELALSADGSAFEGRWRPDGSAGWKPWRGRRVEPVSGRRWLYVIEARWERSLDEREYSYGEMLKAFFSRTPNVEVRRRSFTDRLSLVKWLREAAFLAEPVVVYVSSHGSREGVLADDGPVGAEPIAEALRVAPGVRLLHFGACDVMAGEVARSLRARLGDAAGRFPISGFTETVDWAGSALTDMTYLELILARDYDPARAAQETAELLPFSGRTGPRGPFGRIGLTLLP
ncbi:MAG: hypothetical protein HY554_19185 [Elusimicrobia bacterium]|nr:hypothetical protein [Elusimicrobiota bacterium]